MILDEHLRGPKALPSIAADGHQRHEETGINDNGKSHRAGLVALPLQMQDKAAEWLHNAPLIIPVNST